ncbi:head maturation protease, ClpP-related [uncultured Cohaesibacter sp.]|uniref:head maturation protease, ClpP-related n=1 Tax=uncultured Cohaesibacter sp. TaxID=1002546 RepID=UPI0029C76D5F|nr:head maturation protease, ClpP-related [uncultured Cohaesibacter sp.]
MNRLLIDGELVLYGEVGDGWWGEYFTATEVLEALAEHGSDNDLSVRLNSPGGDAFAGVAIYNALKAHQGAVTIYVDSMAMSAASIIAMAGNEIVMREGSLLMIHEPMTMAWGNAAEMGKVVDSLDKMAEQMAGIYARFSGMDKAECRRIMKEETYFSGEEAVESGFAQRTEDEAAADVIAFDYRTYSKAPEQLKLVAQQNGWTFRPPSISQSAASAAKPSQKKELPMSGKPQAADTNAVDLEKIKADAKAEAIKAERDRREAVTSCEHYGPNQDLAEHLLNRTDLSAEDIVASLKHGVKAIVGEDEPQPTPGELVNDGPAQYAAVRRQAESQQPDLGAGSSGGNQKGSSLLARAQKIYGGSK